MKALDYIKRGWTQNHCAIDDQKNPISATSSRAVCWCAHGAILASYGTYENTVPIIDKLNELSQKKFGTDYVSYNDTPGRTQEEMIALFEEAGV